MRAWSLLLLALSACVSTPANLRAGDQWVATDVNGFPVGASNPPTLRLEDGNRMSGSAGCNRVSATYRHGSRDAISFGPLAVTKMACEAAVMEQERRYLAILSQVQGYSLYGDGGISLVAADGSAIRYRRDR